MTQVRRSPLMGYNHNVRYGGRLFHVQTEDSGVDSPHLHTHLFYEGTILASKRQDYDAATSTDTVRALMQAQHKAIMKELKLASFDEKIAAFFAVRNEPAIPDEPEVNLPESGPGAGIAQALDLDAIGPRTGPVLPVEPPRSTAFARKGGPTERVSVGRPAARGPAAAGGPAAPPVVRLMPGRRKPSVKVAASRAKRLPGVLRWLSWLLPERGPASSAPAPAAPARMEGAPEKPLIDVSDAEIEHMIGAFLSENP